MQRRFYLKHLLIAGNNKPLNWRLALEKLERWELAPHGSKLLNKHKQGESLFMEYLRCLVRLSH
jgi:hypothetical protein